MPLTGLPVVLTGPRKESENFEIGQEKIFKQKCKEGKGSGGGEMGRTKISRMAE